MVFEVFAAIEFWGGQSGCRWRVTYLESSQHVYETWMRNHANNILRPPEKRVWRAQAPHLVWKALNIFAKSQLTPMQILLKPSELAILEVGGASPCLDSSQDFQDNLVNTQATVARTAQRGEYGARRRLTLSGVVLTCSWKIHESHASIHETTQRNQSGGRRRLTLSWISSTCSCVHEISMKSIRIPIKPTK